jgi:hypothetical protein
MAYAWSYKTGEWQQANQPIKPKKHGRLAVSLFRCELDYWVNAILRMPRQPHLFKDCLQMLKKKRPISKAYTWRRPNWVIFVICTEKNNFIVFGI